MVPDYQSTPHDGHHPLLDPGNEWRSGNDPAGIAERFISYGNFAGPGNRLWNEGADPSLVHTPKYGPIDGLDAAAQQHDYAYGRDLGKSGSAGWDDMHKVRGDDRKLVADVNQEMAQNGSQYSASATRYSEGMRGFFGGRVMGEDAVDWGAGKAGEAAQGVSNFVGGAANWHSAGDAMTGIGHGLAGAGSWLADTGAQALSGIGSAGQSIASWGVPGALGAAAGLGDVATAGVGHAAQSMWHWMTE